MGKILELAEALWNGEKDVYSFHPFGMPRGIEKIAEKTWFYRGFSNTIIKETEDGLVIIDPGATWDAHKRFEAIRSVTKTRVNTVIFTHGHVDHIEGMNLYIKESESQGWEKPRVVAHESIVKRFERYKETQGWNGYINLRQFRGGVGPPLFPSIFYEPDTLYSNELMLDVGGVEIRCFHAKGETHDYTWIYFPDSGILVPGDLFIWAVPNAGNPQKVQRFCKEWAEALRKMAIQDPKPKIIAPGHGVPIIGEDRVQESLINTATFLESLHNQTIDLMNQGASLDTVIHNVKPPELLSEKQYLQPVYDESEFIVRNVFRLVGGWYDGTPSHLKPAPEEHQAQEIAQLAGGSEVLAARALKLKEEGKLRLACHLAEWAASSSPNDMKIKEIAAEIFSARAEAETSTMAIGIFQSAAAQYNSDAIKEGSTKKVIHDQDKRRIQFI